MPGTIPLFHFYFLRIFKNNSLIDIRFSIKFTLLFFKINSYLSGFCFLFFFASQHVDLVRSLSSPPRN